MMARGCFGAFAAARLAAARPTHNANSKKQANRQGMCVKESDAIIGKAPRLGIHTVYMCMHTRIHIHTHTYTQIYIPIYLYIYKISSALMHVFFCLRVHD